MVPGENISYAWRSWSLVDILSIDLVDALKRNNYHSNTFLNQYIKISHTFGITLHSSCIMSKVRNSRWPFIITTSMHIFRGFDLNKIQANDARSYSGIETFTEHK